MQFLESWVCAYGAVKTPETAVLVFVKQVERGFFPAARLCRDPKGAAIQEADS